MSPKKILVVDDDMAIRRLVATILELEHYEVDTAGGGREALAKIELTLYDVVVLDLMMPEVSGLEVLKMLEIRSPQIKCVVIMSAASHAYVKKNTTPNVFAAIAKPFDIRALVTTVAECIAAPCGPLAPAKCPQPLAA